MNVIVFVLDSCFPTEVGHNYMISLCLKTRCDVEQPDLGHTKFL